MPLEIIITHSRAITAYGYKLHGFLYQFVWDEKNDDNYKKLVVTTDPAYSIKFYTFLKPDKISEYEDNCFNSI